MIFTGLVFLVLHITDIHGHGYLADPPARSSAWLFDPDFAKCCTYYDHLQMSCGGMYRQWSLNGGKCSICGEAADVEYQQLGLGDAMYLGKIVRTYTPGSTIPVTVVLTANHLGAFEFRVCSVDNDPGTDATQACLDLNVLTLENGLTEYPIGAGYATVYLNVTLPSNLVCKHCVFQWKYRTGNSWGVSARGQGCLGCGKENEEFYGCSDIAIVNSSTPTTIAPIMKKEIQPTARYHNCTSAVVFSQQYDLSGIMQRYCQTICPNKCAMDRVKGGETRYNGCVKSCSVLCTCQ